MMFPSPGGVSRYGNNKLSALLRSLSIGAVVLISDRLAKSLVMTRLCEGQSIKIFPDIFHITLVLNDGVAFGMLKGRAALFVLFSIIVVLFIVAYLFRARVSSMAVVLALGLIVGGAVGNMIDRITIGHVIDFLDFRVWPVFNIADFSISLGAIILILNAILSKKAKVKK